MTEEIDRLTREAIPYIKELRVYAKSVNGCILMKQLDSRFEEQPDGFYKFLTPPEVPHPKYRKGDSWQEELGFTPDEFRSAFDVIGTRYSSKKDFTQSEDSFQGKYFCSYYDRISRLTYYFRNHELCKTYESLGEEYLGEHDAALPSFQKKARNPLVGFIYLIQIKDSEMCKIGLSANPRRRLAQLENASPYELVLVHTVAVKDMTMAEMFLHESYKTKRKRGEWFKLSPSEVSEFCNYEEGDL